MKHTKLIAVFLGVAMFAMIGTQADAGIFSRTKKKARTEKTEEEMKPRRLDYFPTMSFKGGILTRDSHSGWKIGDTPLYMAKNCVVAMAGSEEGSLEEGREAVVMGVMAGGAISAWSIQVSQPSYKRIGMGGSEELKEAGHNPNVGKIIKRAE